MGEATDGRVRPQTSDEIHKISITKKSKRVRMNDIPVI
jgi:hypothetical protein